MIKRSGICDHNGMTDQEGNLLAVGVNDYTRTCNEIVMNDHNLVLKEIVRDKL